MFKTKGNVKSYHRLKIGGHNLGEVNEVKYLGVIISNNLDLNSDIKRATNAFLSQFNSFYHKFNFLHNEVLYFLFKTYATSFYGCGLWFEQKINNNKINKISIVFHKAIKKIAGLLPWDSNHQACSIVGINVFKHFLAKRLFNQFVSIINSKNEIMSKLKYFFIFRSHFKVSLEKMFEEKYDVMNFVVNDQQALLARIDFVERNEPRSYYNEH